MTVTNIHRIEDELWVQYDFSYWCLYPACYQYDMTNDMTNKECPGEDGKAFKFNSRFLIQITSYLSDLEKKGFIKGLSDITPKKQSVITICEDWKPSDMEIEAFIQCFVKESNKEAFRYMIFKYRDNRETFFEECKKYRR